MPQTPELRPCPFCGGEANTEVRHSRIDGVKDRHFPSCLNGDCPAFIVEPYTTYGTKREAIAAWNTRHRQEQRSAEAVAWMPIESAPREQNILVYLPNDRWRGSDGICFAYKHSEYNGHKDVITVDGRCGVTGLKPTHWMPLPSAPGTTPPASEVDVLREAWVYPKSIDDMPKKPGKAAYEYVECLVLHKGELLTRPWNCEHQVFDDEAQDDHFCEWNEVTAYMDLTAARTASENRHD